MNYFVSLHADKTFKHILRMKQFVLTLMMATAVCTTAFAQNKVKNVYASSPTLADRNVDTVKKCLFNSSFIFHSDHICFF